MNGPEKSCWETLHVSCCIADLNNVIQDRSNFKRAPFPIFSKFEHQISVSSYNLVDNFKTVGPTLLTEDEWAHLCLPFPWPFGAQHVLLFLRPGLYSRQTRKSKVLCAFVEYVFIWMAQGYRALQYVFTSLFINHCSTQYFMYFNRSAILSCFISRPICFLVNCASD